MPSFLTSLFTFSQCRFADRATSQSIVPCARRQAAAVPHWRFRRERHRESGATSGIDIPSMPMQTGRDLRSPVQHKHERTEQRRPPTPVTGDRTRQPLHGHRSRTADDIESAYPFRRSIRRQTSSWERPREGSRVMSSRRLAASCVTHSGRGIETSVSPNSSHSISTSCSFSSGGNARKSRMLMGMRFSGVQPPQTVGGSIHDSWGMVPVGQQLFRSEVSVSEMSF